MLLLPKMASLLAPTIRRRAAAFAKASASLLARQSKVVSRVPSESLASPTAAWPRCAGIQTRRPAWCKGSNSPSNACATRFQMRTSGLPIAVARCAPAWMVANNAWQSCVVALGKQVEPPGVPMPLQLPQLHTSKRVIRNHSPEAHHRQRPPPSQTPYTGAPAIDHARESHQSTKLPRQVASRPLLARGTTERSRHHVLGSRGAAKAAGPASAANASELRRDHSETFPHQAQGKATPQLV